jgi:hypothetical protein
LCDRDRFLAPEAADLLEYLPMPDEISKVEGRHVKLFGGGPIWVWAAYLRWLIGAGAASVRVWDMGTKSYVPVYPAPAV